MWVGGVVSLHFKPARIVVEVCHINQEPGAVEKPSSLAVAHSF